MDEERMKALMAEFCEARRVRAEAKAAWEEAVVGSRRKVREAREAYDRAASALEEIEIEMETGVSPRPLLSPPERPREERPAGTVMQMVVASFDADGASGPKDVDSKPPSRRSATTAKRPEGSKGRKKDGNGRDRGEASKEIRPEG